MRNLAIISLVSLAAGCGDYDNRMLKEDLEFLTALPSRETLELRVADDTPRAAALDTTTSGLSIRQQALLGETAQTYLATRQLTEQVNNSLFALLDDADEIMRYPPHRDGNLRTWDPWISPDYPETEARLSMEKNPDTGVFSFWVDVRPASSPAGDWLSCMTGEMLPSAGSFRRGVGEMRSDINACFDFELLEDPATTAVTFDTAPDSDNPEGKTHGQIVYHNFPVRPGEIQPSDTLYVYKENGDLSGEFYYQVWTDFFPFSEDPTALEFGEMLVVWTSRSAGRADFRLSRGDLSEPVFVHECWDEGIGRVYYSDSLDLLPEEGDPADCVFEPAVFD